MKTYKNVFSIVKLSAKERASVVIMRKSYRIHPINNQKDLHREQNRVRRAYQNIEQNWIDSFLSPDAITNTILQSVLSAVTKRNKRSPAPNQADPKHPVTPSFNPKATRPRRFKRKRKKPIGKPEKNYNRLGRSFVFWQAAGLLAFITVNIAKHRRNRR